MTDPFQGFDAASDHRPPSNNRPPDHLSEFYSFVNPPPPSASSQENYTSDSANTSFRKNIGRKPSLTTVNTFSSFAPSALDLPTLITSSDVKVTVGAFQNLVKTASNYREALLQVSNAASEFGQALEECARCKGSGSAADGLLSSGGLHYLVANHQQILAESISKSFELPVSKEIENFEKKYADNDREFKSSIKEKTKALKRNESENLKLSKMKTRNLQRYRNNLMTLTNQIDEIDRLKHDYYLSTFEIVQDSSLKILSRAGSVVRAQVEIYEGIARKGWSGGGLDDLIAQCPDPFNDDDDYDDDDENNKQDEGKDISTGMTNTLLYNNQSNNVSPTSVSNIGSYSSVLTHGRDTEANDSDGTIKYTGNNGNVMSTPPQFDTSMESSTPNHAYDEISGDESFSLPVANQIISSRDEDGQNEENGDKRGDNSGSENEKQEDDNATVRYDILSDLSISNSHDERSSTQLDNDG